MSLNHRFTSRKQSTASGSEDRKRGGGPLRCNGHESSGVKVAARPNSTFWESAATKANKSRVVEAQPGVLTRREIEVLKMIAEGNSTKQIAGMLGIAFKTVVTHRTRLMAKLDIHEAAGLTRYAIRHGLILP